MKGAQLAMFGMTLADEAASPTWKDRWDDAIALLARSGEEFTTDEVRGIAGPPEDHFNACGARLQSAARRGLIEACGYRRSTRAVLHAHPLTLWRGR